MKGITQFFLKDKDGKYEFFRELSFVYESFYNGSIPSTSHIVFEEAPKGKPLHVTYKIKATYDTVTISGGVLRSIYLENTKEPIIEQNTFINA